MNLAMERTHLAKAERDISAGERRITAQASLVGRLLPDHHSVAHAEALLRTLQDTLAVWVAHREEILRQIARLEREPPP